MLLFLLVPLLACLVGSQVIVPGRCPEVPVESFFDGNKYLGVWYFYKIYNAQHHPDEVCEVDEVLSFDYYNFTGYIKVVNKTTNQQIKAPYVATLSNSDQDKAELDFNIEWPIVPTKRVFNIAETDYQNYAIMWSCKEENSKSYRYALVKTRSREVSESVREKVDDFFNNYNLEPHLLVEIDQSNCYSN